MTRTFAVIAASDLAIIELSEKGVGLGIEAGYAYAQKIPLATVARDGISKDVFFYQHFAELVAHWSHLYQMLTNSKK